MNFEIHNMEQGTPEWFQARLGKFTASVFDKVVTKTGKISSQSEDLINRLVAEKVLGEPDDTFQSEAMLRGKDLEDDALSFINFTQGLNLAPVGFLDSGNGYGCSPDALDLEGEIGAEIKCPLPHTHLAYLAAGVIPPKYMPQVQGSMMVTGFKEWIFCSYHPLIESLVVRVKRDDEYIEKLQKALIECSAKVNKKYKTLIQITGMAS